MARVVETYKDVKIMALGDYVRGSGPKTDVFTQKTLDFKNGKTPAIEEMIKLFTNLINGSSVKDKPFYIATIPSSTAGRAHNGFPKLIEALSKTFNVQNTGNLLHRTESKKAAHKGGSREKEVQIATMEVPSKIKSKIEGKSVILMDDVTTTGNSLKAGIDLLKAAKANVIVAIAIGKTTG